jgi:uncharacterized membrane protein
VEATVEQRVEYLEERVKTLETMLEVKARPVPSLEPYPAPQTPRRYPAPPSPKAPPRPEFDLEELLGGRVLGWAGGIAVFIAAVFFVVMAVRNGWIGVEARMVIAFAASTGLVAFGAWLHERRGRLQVARAIVATGLASLYASTAAATLHYHLISPSAGLVIAGAVGVAAFAAAVRWNAQEIAGIGLVGSLLAPVLVGTGTSTSAFVFMAIALVAAIAVVVQRGWVWLTAVAYVVSVPQAAAWLFSENDVHLGAAIAVAGAFWLLYVAAAVGYELLNPAEEDELRYSTASLLLVNAVVAAAGGWFMIDDVGHRAGANAWLFALAGAHVVLGMLVLASRRSREIALLLYAVGAAVAGIAFAVALHGPALVAAWSAEAVLVAWVGRRTSVPERGLIAGVLFAVAAGVHVIAVEVRPDVLAYGLESIPTAVGAVALVLIALAGVAWAYEEVRQPAAWVATALFVYLASGLLVGLAGAHDEVTTQTSQLALSGFWGCLGFAAIVAGLVWRKREVRLAGLGLLALTVGKVLLVDLANLESMWRVGSFLAVGLVLLAGAFAYQRSRALVDRQA